MATKRRFFCRTRRAYFLSQKDGIEGRNPRLRLRLDPSPRNLTAVVTVTLEHPLSSPASPPRRCTSPHRRRLWPLLRPSLGTAPVCTQGMEMEQTRRGSGRSACLIHLSIGERTAGCTHPRCPSPWDRPLPRLLRKTVTIDTPLSQASRPPCKGSGRSTTSRGTG